MKFTPLRRFLAADLAVFFHRFVGEGQDFEVRGTPLTSMEWSRWEAYLVIDEDHLMVEGPPAWNAIVVQHHADHPSIARLPMLCPVTFQRSLACLIPREQYVQPSDIVKAAVRATVHVNTTGLLLRPVPLRCVSACRSRLDAHTLHIMIAACRIHSIGSVALSEYERASSAGVGDGLLPGCTVGDVVQRLEKTLSSFHYFDDVLLHV